MTTTVAMLRNQDPDLREFYITPLYLETLRLRVSSWSDGLIQEQLDLFRQTIPDYPEVAEVLEGELYRRELNRLKKSLVNLDGEGLKALLLEYDRDSDFAELIRTTLEIRNGAKKLKDTSG